MKKIKFLSLLLSIIVVFGMIVPCAAAAEADANTSSAAPYVLRSEEVNDKNTVKVWLELNPVLSENIASYQIALQLQNVNSEAPVGRKMTLDFDESVKGAKIKAAKYDEKTQTLRIYVANNTNLVQTDSSESANILPIGIITVEKTENEIYNPFKLVLLGNDGEFAIADLGYTVKKAADTYGADFVIPVDGTVYGVLVTEEPSTEEPTREEPSSEKPSSEEPSSEETTTEKPDEPKCSCMCHKGGFMGFIYKIVRFFWKLFKMNPVCSCGASHY